MESGDDFKAETLIPSQAMPATELAADDVLPVPIPNAGMHGRVVDTAGNPVSGVDVEIVSSCYPSWIVDRVWRFPARDDVDNVEALVAGHVTRTEGHGQFEARMCRGGANSIVVSRDGVPLWIGRDVKADSNCTLVVATDSSWLAGSVARTDDGSPVDDAVVILWASWETTEGLRTLARKEDLGRLWVRRVRTDALGRWRLQVPCSGQVSITVAAHGFEEATQHIVIVPGESMNLEIAMSRVRTVALRIFDGASDRPIANQRGAVALDGELGAEIQTDADGRVRFSGVTGRDMYVWMEGYGSTAVRLVPDTRAGAGEMNLSLYRSCLVRVRCTDSTRAPLRGVVVGVESSIVARRIGSDIAESGRVLDQGCSISDANGVAEIRGLAAGVSGSRLVVHAFLPCGLRKDLDLDPLVAGEQRSIDLVVPAESHGRDVPR